MRRIGSIALAVVVVLAAVVILRGATGSSGDPYTVRAIFDDASFAAQGEDVRIAGANVGTITSLGVTAANRAAVTIQISNAEFTPFHADATCAIRPQSLIGEEYVDCEPGTPGAPPLALIRRGAGAGSHLLPVTQTSSPVDADIVQDISTEPVREALSVILDELGTGLAARGSDLNAVIHRANPALGYTDRVFRILDSQDHTLARLATDSDAVLAPLARERRQLSDFIVRANTTAVASAARAAGISATFRLFPSFLRRLRPLMADLGTLATQGTPLMTDLGRSGAALGRQFALLTPFAAKARTSLIDLGSAAQQSQTSLVDTLSLAQRLGSLGKAADPVAANLQRLTESLQSSGGIQDLLALLFDGAAAGNGFDALGHYVRVEPLISTCTNYATAPVSGCSADFVKGTTAKAAGASSASAESAASAASSAAEDRLVADAVRSAPSPAAGAGTLHGLLSYLLGGGR
jgi:ABC-type transporter Mla subunit MlaD